MRYPDLTRTQRLPAAKVAGSIQRLTVGVDKDWPLEWKLAELRETTTDPVVYGHALGHVRATAEEAPPGTGQWHLLGVPLLEAMGADEATAEKVQAWRRYGRERLLQKAGMPVL